MTYPSGILDSRAEINVNGWTDITTYVFGSADSPGVAITRGTSDESTSTNPSSANYGFFNPDGRFSSRNPTGPYYPYLVQNTPIRFSLPEGASYLRCETITSTYGIASCPDSVGVSITGDTEIQIDVTLDNWNQAQLLCAKWSATGNNRSWELAVNEDGTLSFSWSSDGSNTFSATSTQAAPIPALHRQAIKVTLATGTGTVTFYTAPAVTNQVLSGPITTGWVQLGSTVVLGNHAVFDSTASVAVGRDVDNSYGYNGIIGKVHSFKLLSGIGGTVKASPDFTVQTPGASSFVDAQSNTWTIAGTAEISNRRYRFHGETASWPQEWDPTGAYVIVKSQANGILRRISQTSKPLNSAVTRYWKRLTGSNAPLQYWPIEDGTNATYFASGLSNGLPLRWAIKPVLAADSSFPGSMPIAQATSGTEWNSQVPAYTATGTNVVRLLVHPDDGGTTPRLIANIYFSGNSQPCQLFYYPSGNVSGPSFDLSFPFGATGSMSAGPLSSSPQVLSLEFVESGSNVTITTRGTPVNQTAQNAFSSASLSGTPGRVSRIDIFPSNKLDLFGILGAGSNDFAGPGSSAVGQIGIQSAVSTFADLISAMNAFAGEAAGIRVSRLCSEEGIVFRSIGQMSTTSPMGLQLPITLMNLLQECVDADRGILFEPRQVLGIGYRARSSLYNQSPAISVSYTNAPVTGLKTADDDQSTLNDVQVSRSSGASSRVVQASGAKSVLAPPAGVGTYDAALTLNVWTDNQTLDEAGWITHIGTVDESRYPSIQWDLSRSAVSSIYHDLQDLDQGDRLVITSNPIWVNVNDITQLIKQLRENWGGRIFAMDWIGIPESPYKVILLDDATLGRVDTDGSTVHSGGVTSGADSMQVDTTAGFNYPLWTTAQSDFPFDILCGGERMTVTDINGPAINFLTGDTRNFAASLGNWANPTNCALLQVSSPAQSGSGAMRMRSSAAGDMTAGHCDTANILTQGLACSPNDQIACAAWFQAATTGRSCAVGCNFYTNAGVFISTILGSNFSDVVGSYTKVTALITAPATAAFAKLITDVRSTGAANEDHFVDTAYISNRTTGAANVQSFTVTRSVNGVVKAHSAGDAVSLFFPAYVAM